MNPRLSTKRSSTYEYKYDGYKGLRLADLAELVTTIQGEFPTGDTSLKIATLYPGPQSDDNTVTLRITAEVSS
jgi:hypothetical protein